MKRDNYRNGMYALNLRQCLSDETLVIPLPESEVIGSVVFIRESIENMDWEEVR